MPERMTPEQADALIARVGDLSDKLALSEKQRAETQRIAQESHDAAEAATQAGIAAKRTADRQKWYTRVLLLLFVVTAFFVNEQREDGKDIERAVAQNKANAVATCESGNRRLEGTRADKQGEWELQDAAADAQGFEEGNPVREYYRELLEWRLSELYPFRDCDHLDKQIPTPGPPPSFDEALAEALRIERQQQQGQ